SFIGYFYQFGIGCDVDDKVALEFYLTANNNEIANEPLNFNELHLTEESDDEFNSLKSKNTIIGKYLLSLFYYKDIILDIEGFNYKHLTESNNNELIQQLLKLAKNGNSEAQYKLATCYINGIGI